MAFASWADEPQTLKVASMEVERKKKRGTTCGPALLV
jgi:hypothetical protein